MTVTAVAVVAILSLGNMWWTSIANANARNIVYKPPPMEVSLLGNNQLTLKLGSSYWHELRKAQQLDKIIPDHGHLMHLFLIRMPDMDRFYHLHPEETGTATFAETLPEMTEGQYAVFADIVRESGFPDTMVAQLAIPAGSPISAAGLPRGDDSAAAAAPTSHSKPNTAAELDDGGQVDWLDGQNVQAQKPRLLRFRVLDKNGKPAADLEPYMGMSGHLVIVRRDLSVFAHVHPTGSIPMAALMLLEKGREASGDSMAAMNHEAVTPEITFPYGFPQRGSYRLFLQVKRAGQVETAVFDVDVAP
jgi:hypothetical protein